MAYRKSPIHAFPVNNRDTPNHHNLNAHNKQQENRNRVKFMKNNITSCSGVNVFEINRLRWLAVMSYAYPAPYKTGAGRENPKLLQATPDAASVFFVVRYMRHSMAWCVIRQRSYNRRSVALLAYHAAHDGAMCSNRCAGLAPNPLAPKSTPRRPVMVTLAGQSQDWPVSCNAGILTPVNVTALFERENSGGDSVNLLQEAA
ncbi:TPA: ash family protein [Salmonella enterica]|uniref:Ash family protein n=1 Tax=Salmonella enterica TaxID=28901 RepID=A0A743P8D1_SALER|nr:ash family protein [Salmonella enterica]